LVDDTSSDAEIIAASLIDPDCFGLLFERHFQAVFSYAVRSSGVTEGQEIASEVFVQAFSSRRRFDLGYRSARPWLLGIASNLVSTRYRSFERRNRAHRRAFGRDYETEEFETEVADRVDASSHSERARAALAALRPPERTVVLLFIFGGLSYQEIADVLDLREGTVKSRLSRGRANLRNALADIGEQWGNDE
jgi:RNA polymerase sigma-70 factor (ECF subfamily)